jgi:hypothetical protein
MEVALLLLFNVIIISKRRWRERHKEGEKEREKKGE